MEKDFKYMVTTRCISYNHAPYILDALDGFIIQETTFPVVYTVIDDASTDDTQSILHEWADCNLLSNGGSPLWREMPYGQLAVGYFVGNQRLLFVIILLAENHAQTGRSQLKSSYIAEWINMAKYIAICEGDDYWIDCKKLQKQVDFMESHPDYSMCFHNAICLNVQKNQVYNFNNLKEGDLSVHDAIHNWFVPTASMLYITKMYEIPSWMAQISSGDYSLILRCVYAGKVYGFSKFMSVYRRNNTGTSATARTRNHQVRRLNEHKILLESFKKGTQGRFDSEINARINQINIELKYYHVLENVPKWKHIFYPVQFVKILKMKLISRLKVIINSL